MRKLCKFLCVFTAIVCLLTSFSSFAYAKTVYSNSKMISNYTGYKNSKTTMYGQTRNEKAVSVSKNKVLKVEPYTITNNKNNIKNYVCFTVWIYDINTGKRIVNKVCSNGSYITWKNTTGKTANLSVQVFPYISQSAWKKYGYNSINAYILSTQYKIKCNNNY